MNLTPHIEALIFSSAQPINLKELKFVLDTTFEQTIEKKVILLHIEQLVEKYNQDDHGIELVYINEGYQFLSKAAYHPTIANHLKHITNKKLSRVTMETLAIIAYKQPVTKPALERIRGVNCDYAVNKLLEKELINILGRSDAPGRPLLYGTSEKFINYFGLGSIDELPKLKDFGNPENTIGELNEELSVTSGISENSKTTDEEE